MYNTYNLYYSIKFYVVYFELSISSRPCYVAYGYMYMYVGTMDLTPQAASWRLSRVCEAAGAAAAAADRLLPRFSFRIATAYTGTHRRQATPTSDATHGRRRSRKRPRH
jgi:hypothetical protein